MFLETIKRFTCKSNIFYKMPFFKLLRFNFYNKNRFTRGKSLADVINIIKVLNVFLRISRFKILCNRRIKLSEDELQFSLVFDRKR